jgi:hypothetical protein
VSELLKEVVAVRIIWKPVELVEEPWFLITSYRFDKERNSTVQAATHRETHLAYRGLRIRSPPLPFEGLLGQTPCFARDEHPET